MRTLGELTRELNLSRMSLIKMDTEGYELKVLRGVTATVGTLKPDIVGEAHPHFSDSADMILKYLQERSYGGETLVVDPGYEEIFYARPLT